jgi:hypothetical protein
MSFLNRLFRKESKLSKGNGIMKDLEFKDLRDFKKIELNIPANLYYTVDNDPYLKMTIDENLSDAIECRFFGDKAVIQLTNEYKNVGIQPTEKKIVMSSRDLNYICVNGSGEAYIGYITSENFEADINGSGLIKIEYLSSEHTSFEIVGSGNIEIKYGNITKTYMEVSGSGMIDCKAKCQKAKTDIAGSGSIFLYCTNELNYDIVGSGVVLCEGNCSINGNTSGSGRIIKI